MTNLPLLNLNCIREDMPMTDVKRPVVITGNWKMHKTMDEAKSFVQELVPLVQQTPIQVGLAVPFTFIRPVSEQTKGTNVVIGAQNMHDAAEGAFTGEIAAKMLKEAGAQFVLLGHSERRRLFHESNAFINRKIKRAIAEELKPTLCIGETLEERENGMMEEIIRIQLSECLADLSSEQLATLTIAYEPVWAIGTDQAATPEMAQAAHQICRAKIAETWGELLAKQIVIQYGGAVKPDNVEALLEQPDIDGLLIGGASLSLVTFSKIINYAQKFSENTENLLQTQD